MVFRKGILLAGFDGKFHFVLKDGGDGNDGHPLLIERLDDLPGKGFLEELAGAAHGPDLIPFFADHLLDPALGRHADPAAEGRTAEDAHGAAVAVFGALARGAGGAGGVDKDISVETNFFFPLFPGNGLDSSVLHFHIIHAGREVNFNPFCQEKSFNNGFHGGDIIKRGVGVARKFDIPVEASFDR